MRSFLVAFASLIVLSTHAAQANVAISVDQNTQTMTVAVDGVARYRWPVSTGIPSRATPDGTFRAFRMEADHFSKEFDDAPMPHSIFFTKVGHAIHGTESEGRLGTPASHGCVRLSRANAATLYALVEKEGVLNTTVTLTGSSQVWLARNGGRMPTAVADNQPYQQQYSAQGQPIDITPQQPMMQNQWAAQPRPDDGYIYPADGSSDARIYPAPPSARRVYDAQAYPQPRQSYYNNYARNPQYAPPPGYYQQRPLYQQPRSSFYQD